MDSDNNNSQGESFLRVKFRDPPHQPKLKNVTENVSMSAFKKVKPEEIDPYADAAPIRTVPPVYFPGHTQNTRIEKKIVSNEAQYREEVRPNMYERMEFVSKHAKIKEKMDAARKKRDDMKKKFEDDLQKMRDEANDKLKEAESKAEDAKADSKDGDKGIQSLSEKMESGFETESDDGGSDGDGLTAAEKQAFLDAALDIKEKKIVKGRRSKVCYNTLGSTKVMWYGMKMHYGFGKRDPKISLVTPYLAIGNYEIASGMQYMIKMHITHVMNVTTELNNNYPQHFVYCRIPLKDNMEADGLARFPSACKFIERCWQSRGKILIHCNMGISRAPAMAIAWLIAYKHVTLLDAYELVVSQRPRCNINRKFLLDLAEWELLQGEGSSVMYHKDWMFYEFNSRKGDKDVFYRQSYGVYKTAKYLWSDLKLEEDAFFN